MITVRNVEPSRTAIVFNAIMDGLAAKGLDDRAELIAGLITVLAVQVRGQMLTTEQLQDFTVECAKWATCYLMPTGVAQ